MLVFDNQWVQCLQIKNVYQFEEAPFDHHEYGIAITLSRGRAVVCSCMDFLTYGSGENRLVGPPEVDEQIYCIF